jgi:hypothetical protein
MSGSEIRILVGAFGSTDGRGTQTSGAGSRRTAQWQATRDQAGAEDLVSGETRCCCRPGEGRGKAQTSFWRFASFGATPAATQMFPPVHPTLPYR